MFQRRLGVALLALTLLTLIQGGVAVWAIDGARQKVELGRLSSDLHAGFLALSDSKHRLQTWLSRAPYEANLDLDQHDALLEEMRLHLERLQQISETLAGRTLAEMEQPASLTEERQIALNVFSQFLDTLEGQAALVPVDVEPSDLNQFEGRDLRLMMADTLSRERTLLAKQRSEADHSLQQLMRMVILTTLTLSAIILLVFWHFARALRRPIGELMIGAQALQRGELNHRIDDSLQDEFGRIAAHMNHMASELDRHRRTERDRQQRLEDLVEMRTRELAQALERLRQLSQQRQQLLEDISHELRTPATSIRGEAEITLRGQPRSEAEYRQALQRIADDAAHLSGVISDLLTMARSDIAEWQIQRKPLDPLVPLRDAIGQASTLGRLRGIGVSTGQLETATLLGDVQRLQQVFGILLDNAIQYSHHGGQVWIGTQVVQHQATWVWELQVRDHGIGLVPHEASRIFERGYRSAEARRHRPDGQGVGLTIAMLLIRLHGGELMLENREGGGCQALLRLPVHMPEADGPPTDADSPDALPS
ncbi:MAG: HAMP domain-containing histidine kinase [Halomonas sp.]|nr:ATP-binding protein [Halomonas sp.]MCC5883297.1 HAMP domain-containing histidine kinase [Halomonas sp.]